MTTSRLTIPGMSCDACHATIEGALAALPGVTAVRVDLECKLVTVEHDGERARAVQLVEAVEGQGYEVASREAL
jgi:copper chaperone CopZ